MMITDQWSSLLIRFMTKSFVVLTILTYIVVVVVYNFTHKGYYPTVTRQLEEFLYTRILKSMLRITCL